MDINVIGPVNMLGYGIVTLNIVKALSKQGKVALWPIGPVEAHPEEHDLIRSCVENAQFFDVDSPCLRIYHQFDMALHAGRGVHAGLPIFELDTFSELELHHLRSLDHIFVGSQWAKNVIEKNGVGNSRSCSVIPFGVDTEIFSPGPSLVDEKTTLFLSIGKWEIRKGHDIICEAFNRAFEPTDDVRLIMNCHNPFLVDPANPAADGNKGWTNLYRTSRLGNKISVIPDRLPTQMDVAKLMNTVDCGLFPARAEGWNLELLEMMACGKQVIATDYSAHTQFCDDDNCMLIDTTDLEEAYDGKWFKGQGKWALVGEPQIEQLIAYMRSVHQKKRAGVSLYNESGVETAKLHSWDRTAELIVSRLSHERNSN